MAKRYTLKTLIITVIVVVLALGTTVGIILLGARSCKDTTTTNRVSANMLYFENNQEVNVGEPIAFRLYAYTDKEFSEMSYSLNNDKEVKLPNVKSGKAEEHALYDGEDFEYVIDSGIQMIQTTKLSTGYYTLVIYAHNDDGKTQLNSAPYVFRVI